MNRKHKLLSPLFATALLAACGAGGGLNGTYAGPDSVISYTFQPDGKVQVKTMGATVEMRYEVEGGQVKIGPSGGPQQVMKILDDGSLSGPMGTKLTKQP